MLKLWPRPPHHISLAPSGSGAAKGGSSQRCSLSGERLNPRGGEKEAREDSGETAFGMPRAQLRWSYLKGVSCPDTGGSLETSVSLKRTAEMPNPLKENTHNFLESRKEMEDLKKDGRNGVTGNTQIPFTQSHILVSFCS